MYIDKINELLLKNHIAELVIVAIMNNELEKTPDNMNTDIVDFCVDVLCEIRDYNNDIAKPN